MFFYLYHSYQAVLTVQAHLLLHFFCLLTLFFCLESQGNSSKRLKPYLKKVLNHNKTVENESAPFFCGCSSSWHSHEWRFCRPASLQRQWLSEVFLWYVAHLHMYSTVQTPWSDPCHLQVEGTVSSSLLPLHQSLYTASQSPRSLATWSKAEMLFILATTFGKTNIKKRHGT